MHVSHGRNSKWVFKSGQRHIRQKATTGVTSLKAFRTVEDGFGSTNLLWASLNDENKIHFPEKIDLFVYLGIVTQRV